MRFLLRLIALLVVFFSALSAVRRLIGALTSSKPTQVRGRPGHLVKDPVCGTYVPQESALSARGEFFCSEACRDQWMRML